mmetsp:Transcript_7422/g.11813  ORF Transcript_7422/g.11813 Transcript_7422/m.11813 type:complete len:92 (-) Transcript_7422:1262-1537(-)
MEKWEFDGISERDSVGQFKWLGAASSQTLSYRASQKNHTFKCSKDYARVPSQQPPCIADLTNIQIWKASSESAIITMPDTMDPVTTRGFFS